MNPSNKNCNSFRIFAIRYQENQLHEERSKIRVYKIYETDLCYRNKSRKELLENTGLALIFEEENISLL